MTTGFPVAAGAMADGIRGFDWGSTTLGPVGRWPQSLRTVLELMLAARQPVYVAWGPDLVSLYNDAYVPILGSKHPGAIGQPFARLFAEIWDEYRPLVEAVMAGESLHYVDRPVALGGRPGRPVGWFTFSLTPLRDEEGRIAGFFCAATETTAKVRAERALRERHDVALRESEAKYRALFESIDSGFCIIEMIFDAADRPRDYRFLEVNPAFERQTGLRDAIGRTVCDLVPGHEAHWFDTYGRVALTGEPVRFENRAAGLDGRWYDVFAFRIGRPEQRQVAVLFNDITARRRGEERLREREERLRLIVEAARDYAILTTDPDGRIDGWLPGAAHVFGWTEEEAVGMPVDATFTPEDRDAGVPARERETAVREGSAPNVRWHLRKDGSRVFIEGRSVALRDPDGGLRGFLKIGQDVTARRAAEERQALLAREVDHRAKNALAVVGAALRLTKAPDLPSYVRAIEGRIGALARAQTLLANDRWAGADLRGLLRGELAAFLDPDQAGGPQVALLGPPVALPAGAAQPLGIAVHELATNAVKYGALSSPAGRVAVTWSREGQPGTLRLRWAEAGGPQVSGPPQRRGFGSRVLDGTVRGQLGGSVTLAWGVEGLVCDLVVPLDRAAEAADGAGQLG
ncbi:PAS domain S-box protein [Falsiroseomonas sp. CW058]|uniref:PAS domain-containing sensor histidine kinase n=1 Tax=Falsiroseomonas sp. CW058 TaxID=3388664 RepID=UPI003D321366